MTVLGPIKLTEDEEETYDSSHVRQFAWTDDPAGTPGLLYVEFQDGGAYVYKGVPRDEYDALVDRAYEETQPMGDPAGQTTGEYLQRNIVKEYTEEDVEYNRFEDLLD